MPVHLRSIAAVVSSLAALVSATIPCDLFSEFGYSCAAAYSTTRLLRSNYTGPLYQVQRTSDGKSFNVGTVSTINAAEVRVQVADAQAQDKFCTRTQCTVTTISDQSGNGNNLVVPAGLHPAVANQAPTTLNGVKVYGLSLPAGTGYRLLNNQAGVKVPINDEAEVIYAVVSGSVYNSGCCWDFGNAETGQQTGGAGTVEALYFGSRAGSTQNFRSGKGPWLEADFGDRLYGSLNKSSPSPSISAPFVFGILKGSNDQYALRGGDAQNFTLSTYYEGLRPASDHTMRKQGGVTLGMGGVGGSDGEGVFFEGAIVQGYSIDYSDGYLLDNVATARYGLPTMP